jgi:NAD(P)H-dependent FMN reductase
MAKSFIPVILGTGREGSRTEMIANFVEQALKDKKVNTQLIHVSDFAGPVTVNDQDDERVQAWREIVEKSDAMIVVTPEYNHGYPGELKIVLDMVLHEYEGIPFGVCTVASGSYGGGRAADQLNQVAMGLKMIPLPRPVHFRNIKAEMKDKELHEAYSDRLEKFFDQIIYMAENLKK